MQGPIIDLLIRATASLRYSNQGCTKHGPFSLVRLLKIDSATLRLIALKRLRFLFLSAQKLLAPMSTFYQQTFILYYRLANSIITLVAPK